MKAIDIIITKEADLPDIRIPESLSAYSMLLQYQSLRTRHAGNQLRGWIFLHKEYQQHKHP